jgi:hypothetical protein
MAGSRIADAFDSCYRAYTGAAKASNTARYVAATIPLVYQMI